jgi:hypothetical protein
MAPESAPGQEPAVWKRGCLQAWWVSPAAILYASEANAPHLRHNSPRQPVGRGVLIYLNNFLDPESSFGASVPKDQRAIQMLVSACDPLHETGWAATPVLHFV